MNSISRLKRPWRVTTRLELETSTYNVNRAILWSLFAISFSIIVCFDYWIRSRSVCAGEFSVSTNTQVFATPNTSWCHVVFPGSGSRSQETGEGSAIWPWQKFKTANFTPPEFHFTTRKTLPSSSGAVFINYRYPDIVNPTFSWPAIGIFTDRGELIWAQNIPESRFIRNFAPQTLYGKPVLTYWSTERPSFVGQGYGQVNILDTTYNQTHTVCLKLGLNVPEQVRENKCQADFHEAYISAENTMLVTSFNITTADLTAVGGPKDGWIYDCLAVELDIETSEVLWTWSALEHVDLSTSRMPVGIAGTKERPWDFFHMNSIQRLGNKYLINSRFTFSTYFVDANGQIEWTIDGETGGDFGPLPSGGNFAWQHEVRIQSMDSDSVTISLFNNDNTEMTDRDHFSSGLTLHLPLPPGSSPVNVSKALHNPNEPAFAMARGGMQMLSDGHSIVSYGSTPLLQEWNAKDELVWEAKYGFEGESGSYRSFKSPWVSVPTTLPSVVMTVGKNPEDCVVKAGYVSWAGATTVTHWSVYTGSGAGNMTRLGQVPKKGFETKFDMRLNTSCVSVGALADGEEIRLSEIVCDPKPPMFGLGVGNP